MKLILVLGMVGLGTLADAKPFIDERFKVTFSDYGKFNDFVKCTPGTDGSYPTQDVITLHSYTLEHGLLLHNQKFTAYHSPTQGFKSGRPRPRPFSEGCAPALRAIRTALGASDPFEVEIHRTVDSRPEFTSRVVRNLDGNVQRVIGYEVNVLSELLEVEIAGLQFTLHQSINAEAKQR